MKVALPAMKFLMEVTGVFSMVHELNTIFSGKASLGEKVKAGIGLAVNLALDFSDLWVGHVVGLLAEGLGHLAEGIGGLSEGLGHMFEGAGDVARSAAEAIGLCSFTPTTKVATKKGKQPIGKLHVGEQVLAYNPKTHKMEYEPILHVWIHKDNDLVNLTLTTKSHAPHSTVATTTSEVIHTNKKHPFFTEEQGFVPVAQLKLGMHVLRADGQYGVITGYRIVPGSAMMYNLEVQQDHTFVVGSGEWVVHNSCQPFDIVEYGDKNPGFENHHGVLDAWAKNNIPGYVSRAADGPAMALTDAQHAETKAVYRDWLFGQTGRYVGASVNWANISPREIFGLSEGMFDAAGVPGEARQAYYRAFHQYIYTGSWKP